MKLVGIIGVEFDQNTSQTHGLQLSVLVTLSDKGKPELVKHSEAVKYHWVPLTESEQFSVEITTFLKNPDSCPTMK